MTRQSLRILSRPLIGLLLFGQIAIAAYACPALAAAMNVPISSVPFDREGTPNPSAADPAERVVGCDGMNGTMDPSFANLCAEHCRYGQQSDQVPTVTVPVVLLNTLYVAPRLSEPSLPSHSAAAATGALAVASPPHAILHCCFRF